MRYACAETVINDVRAERLAIFSEHQPLKSVFGTIDLPIVSGTLKIRPQNRTPISPFFKLEESFRDFQRTRASRLFRATVCFDKPS